MKQICIINNEMLYITLLFYYPYFIYLLILIKTNSKINGHNTNYSKNSLVTSVK
jgi:Ca2+/Na+ antiporter